MELYLDQQIVVQTENMKAMLDASAEAEAAAQAAKDPFVFYSPEFHDILKASKAIDLAEAAKATRIEAEHAMALAKEATIVAFQDILSAKLTALEAYLDAESADAAVNKAYAMADAYAKALEFQEGSSAAYDNAIEYAAETDPELSDRIVLPEVIASQQGDLEIIKAAGSEAAINKALEEAEAAHATVVETFNAVHEAKDKAASLYADYEASVAAANEAAVLENAYKLIASESIKKAESAVELITSTKPTIATESIDIVKIKKYEFAETLNELMKKAVDVVNAEEIAK